MFYLILLISFNLSAFAKADHRLEMFDISYSKRLEMVKNLATRYPGYVKLFGSESRKQGLWSGIYLQTKWQLDSKRSHLETWNAINTWLTIVPFYISKNYNCTHSRFIQNIKFNYADKKAPISIKEVCESWVRYFKLAKNSVNRFSDPLGIKKRKLKKQLWKAHGDSIKYSLWANKELLSNDHSEEWYFWANWTYFVYYLERFNFPTFSQSIKPIKKILMPVCYPIDDSSCYNSLNFIKKTYVDFFTRRSISLDKIIWRIND